MCIGCNDICSIMQTRNKIGQSKYCSVVDVHNYEQIKFRIMQRAEIRKHNVEGKLCCERRRTMWLGDKLCRNQKY